MKIESNASLSAKDVADFLGVDLTTEQCHIGAASAHIQDTAQGVQSAYKNICVFYNGDTGSPFSSHSGKLDLKTIAESRSFLCFEDEDECDSLSPAENFTAALGLISSHGHMSPAALFRLAIASKALYIPASVTIKMFMFQPVYPEKWQISRTLHAYLKVSFPGGMTAKDFIFRMVSAGVFAATSLEIAVVMGTLTFDVLLLDEALKSFSVVPHQGAQAKFKQALDVLINGTKPMLAAMSSDITSGMSLDDFSETLCNIMGVPEVEINEYAVRHVVAKATLQSVRGKTPDQRAVGAWFAKMLCSISKVAKDEHAFWKSVVVIDRLAHSNTSEFTDGDGERLLGREMMDVAIATVYTANGDEAKQTGEGRWVRAMISGHGSSNLSFSQRHALFFADMFVRNRIDTSVYAGYGPGNTVDSFFRYILAHHHKHTLLKKPVAIRHMCAQNDALGRAARKRNRASEAAEREKAARALPPPPPPDTHPCALPTLLFNMDICITVLGISTTVGDAEPLLCGIKMPAGRVAHAPGKPSQPRIAVSGREATISLTPGPTGTMRNVCAVEFRARVLGNKPEYAEWFTLAHGNSLEVTAKFPERYLRNKDVRHDFCAVYHGPGGVSRPSDIFSVNIHIRPEPVVIAPASPVPSSAASSPASAPGPERVLRDMLALHGNPGKKKRPTAQQIAVAVSKAREAGLDSKDEDVVRADAIVAKAEAAREKRLRKKERTRYVPVSEPSTPPPKSPRPETPPAPCDDPPSSPAATPVQDSEVECPVCMENIMGMMVVKYPCLHEVCFECASQWLKVNGGVVTTCSLCRSSANASRQ